MTGLYAQELGRDTLLAAKDSIDENEALLSLSERLAQWKWNGTDTETTVMVIAGLLVLLLLLVWIARSIARFRKGQGPSASKIGNPDIVVYSKTASVLKRQSLDDVRDNPSYLQIDCSEFCEDSAVRRMYLRNTCILDIYNMYAEDLRNPDNPKEDGCMVLGRWVLDEDTGDYDVSLEHIVLPGDDAVFKEYELNFGGKIKLKVTEKLRKLRRETELQYDLTCWVHSHPGLGVFFSNSDNNVHLQLKNPLHPDFLTAIVIDILTPDQEMGIFTFRHDGTVNSKSELKRMYSLEELYQWAVTSKRNAFRKEDHFNILSKAESKGAPCHGIWLSNGAVIDMIQLTAEQGTGFVSYVHGFSVNPSGKEYAVTAIREEAAIPDNDQIGCFVMATHCSIPSVRKAVSGSLARIKFVLVYSTADGALTAIPVKDADLSGDVKYYGEEQFEDLKIWTRRKR